MLYSLTIANKETIGYNGNLINESITNLIKFTDKGVTYLGYLGKPAVKQNTEKVESYIKSLMPLYKGKGSLPAKPITKLISSNAIKISSSSNLSNLIANYVTKVSKGIKDPDKLEKFYNSAMNADTALANKEFINLVTASGMLPLKNYKGIIITKQNISIFFGLSIFNPKGLLTKVTSTLKDYNNSKQSNLTIDILKDILGVSSNDPLF